MWECSSRQELQVSKHCCPYTQTLAAFIHEHCSSYSYAGCCMISKYLRHNLNLWFWWVLCSDSHLCTQNHSPLFFFFKLDSVEKIRKLVFRIWGLHDGDYKECRILGCSAMWVLWEPTFRRNVSPPSSG
jgi:hypothetical protein